MILELAGHPKKWNPVHHCLEGAQGGRHRAPAPLTLGRVTDQLRSRRSELEVADRKAVSHSSKTNVV